MITGGLLDQLLKSANQLIQGQGAQTPAARPSGMASSDSTGGLNLGSLLAGAGGGTALGLLLGNKKARKMGGKIAVYGGLAAVGVIAYKAYGQWQQKQGNQSMAEIRTVDRLPAPQVEEHSRAVLRALIAAAKADGHVDQRERQLIDAEVARLTNDAQLQHWFDQELQKPLDPVEVASAASTPEMAAEMYLASLLVIDEDSFMERAYLEELAKQLRIEPGLKRELENQVRDNALI
ncbi:MAG: DUF533 domain-containing protein [Gammaproteobacteria bacterium HGW-Gammaproteobacteria-11]|nr:MAG: DUF533 domain-containing protein [Gammaproteobacteria bacterium HGW-Gammaproteobacteria-11]